VWRSRIHHMASIAFAHFFCIQVLPCVSRRWISYHPLLKIIMYIQVRGGTSRGLQSFGHRFQVVRAFQPRGGVPVVRPREHAHWPLAPRAPLRSQHHPRSGKGWLSISDILGVCMACVQVCIMNERGSMQAIYKEEESIILQWRDHMDNCSYTNQQVV